MKTGDIQIRDPFVVPDPGEGGYYLFGTTDKNCWTGPAVGFDAYRGSDLEDWEGPLAVFRPPPGFWATEQFWAPEVHPYRGRYIMAASFKAPGRYRGTQVLTAGRLEGPYQPLTEGPVTPADWQCLDGTLHVDEEGKPWMVFCHEWVQVHNGAIFAMRLTEDLRQAAERPVFLFNASEAPWVARSPWPEEGSQDLFPTYVTDGPFLFRGGEGALFMLWSSMGTRGYAMGVARSESGTVAGPWIQQAEPLWGEDGGHGMIFRAFDGRLLLTFHSPNRTPRERPVFREIQEDGRTISVV